MVICNRKNIKKINKSNRLHNVCPIKWTNFVVFEPLLETVFVKYVAALFNSPILAFLDVLCQANGALRVLHGVVVVQEFDDAIVAADGRTLPIRHAFRQKYKHAGKSKSHDGVHVN
jgi:hypothetical protein